MGSGSAARIRAHSRNEVSLTGCDDERASGFEESGELFDPLKVHGFREMREHGVGEDEVNRRVRKRNRRVQVYLLKRRPRVRGSTDIDHLLKRIYAEQSCPC